MSNTAKHPPTLKQIAEKVGLTAAAVSLALRGDPSIPRATCARVTKAAKELGYTPDPELGRLMSYLRKHREVRTVSALGLLSLHKEPSKWHENNFLRRLHESMVARAGELGFMTEDFFFNDPRITAARMRDILLARGIKGLVIVCGPSPVDSVNVDLSPFASVTIGYGVGLPLHRVCQHQYEEMFLLLEHLRALGYKRPGLVLETEIDRRTRHHYSSAFTISAGGGRRKAVPGLLRPAIGKTDFKKWARAHSPDVVIAQGSLAALGYADWLAELGKNTPRDIGVAALDVDTFSRHDCSGIVQDYEAVAAAAIELAASQVRCGEKGIPETPKVLMIKGRWRDGGTTRAQKTNA
ncbi:substrate-binding domain-containing protein [Ereboglobus luteus]|uniref:substrate-binding domain-containing protein n=1 Tax=Ereboglobus luteus TaxID=1796921 RepID=UPI001374F986|nr:substrate-binding domain-containing protein [Ereboglobus luteus]